MIPNTLSPLFQQSVRANNSWYSNRVGYKMKDAVQQLNENTTIEKKREKDRRRNYQKAADTFEEISTITEILRG